MQICVRANWLIIPLITIALMLLNQWLMKGQWNWYFALKLPFITPPAWVFGAVWMLIYILTTLCALIVFNFFEHTMQWYGMITLFIINAVLHGMWPYLFFVQHQLGFAALNTGMQCLTVWILIGLIKQHSWFTMLLLLPQGLWLLFATGLWFWVSILN